MQHSVAANSAAEFGVNVKCDLQVLCYFLIKPAFHSWLSNLPSCCSPNKSYVLKFSALHCSCFVGAFWQPKATLQIKGKASQEYLKIQVEWKKMNKMQLS